MGYASYARENAAASGFPQTVFQEADITKLPLPGSSADIVISNAAINLARDKYCVLEEVFRVLLPGGRLQIAGMVCGPSAEILLAALLKRHGLIVYPAPWDPTHSCRC